MILWLGFVQWKRGKGERVKYALMWAEFFVRIGDIFLLKA